MTIPEQQLQSTDSITTEHSSQATALTIAITSGKGGVGKTNVTTNLGIALAKAGKKVCVFDADTSLANINILLKQTPQFTLEHFLREQMSIQDILLDGPSGLKVVPSATGITDFVLLTAEQQDRLIAALEQLEREFDYILIDTAAGIGDSVIRFIQSAQYSVVVISPEPTSLTDAFSLIKVLKRRNHKQPVYILVNMANNYAHSMEVFKRFAHAVNKYIDTKVRYLGYIPSDKAIRDSVASQSPVVLSAPDSPAGRCINLLANILLKHFSKKNAPVRKISQFWRDQSEKQGESANADFMAQKQTAISIDNAPLTHEEPSAEVAANQADTYHDARLAIDSKNLSQDQTESLLADIIQYYLGEFGTLPSQAIDLTLQAHAQGELSDSQLETLQQSLSAESEEQITLQTQSCEAVSLDQIRTQIDNLVAEAEKTKLELTDLAQYVVEQYRNLYNDSVIKPSSVTSITTAGSQARNVQCGTAQEDRQALLQSIEFAAAVDES